MKTLGFTLLETIIYIALFGVLMSGALVTVYSLLGSVASNQKFEAAYSEGLFVNQKMARLLSEATDLVVIDRSTLKIIRLDSSVFLFASSSQWWLTTSRGSTLPLSSAGVHVSDVLLDVSQATSEKPAVIRVQYHIGNIPFSLVMYLQQ